MRAPTTSRAAFPSGSYVVIARVGEREVHYPLVIERAYTHRLTIRMPSISELPEGMILIPGGPFRMAGETHTLRDYAIGQFPVTLRSYVDWLDTLHEGERQSRIPGLAGVPALRKTGDRWRLTEAMLEGEGRKRVAEECHLDLPVHEISWYDACGYIGWLSKSSDIAYRLPTSAEWEKAMRGADGRFFPMGNELDPSFAKLRQSRPEASQPEPVGAFPIDRSPYGVRDLAGGVADWTQTFLDGQPPASIDDEGNPDADARQATYCGGHWGSVARQRGVQYHMSIKHRTSAVGFRLALSLDQSGSSELSVEPMRP